MSSHVNQNFERNVFTNCPLDEEYFALLRPLLFTIIYLGYNPRIALERSDSGEIRINKICELIQASQYSIHDLSRLKSAQTGEFYRLNMPFELGIEYGCRRFASGRLREKRCLILEKEKYDYMKALSDISGVDIKNHNNEPIQVVQSVRNWFIETVGLRKVDGSTKIWYQFNDFASDLYDTRKEEGFSDEDLNMMPVPEYIDFVREWVEQRDII